MIYEEFWSIVKKKDRSTGISLIIVMYNHVCMYLDVYALNMDT